MFHYSDILISKFWPDVAKIEIKTKQTYLSAFGKFEKETNWSLTPDRYANFPVRCINTDCTAEYFDLFSVVSSLAAHHQETGTGTLECIGNEASDHNNSCPCKLDYEIKIEYIPAE